MKKYLSIFIMLLAAMIWGFAFVAQKAAVAIPPFTLCTVRAILAVLILIPSVVMIDKLSNNGRCLVSKRGIDFKKSELIGGIICGVILFVASNLQQFGIGEGTDAGKASFITALYIVIVPILHLFFRKKPPINVWIGIGIAVIGFYLLCIKSDFSIAPSDFLVFMCAFVFAMQIIAIDKIMSYEGTDGVRLSCIQFIVMGILSLISALIFEGEQDLSLIFNHIPELLYIGILSSGVAYTLQILGQKNTPPATASMIFSLESVFGAIAGCIVLGEVMSAKEYFGCIVIFSAVILSQLELPKRKNIPEK